MLLEKKLEKLSDLLEQREVQISEVLAAAQLDPVAVVTVNKKLEVRDSTVICVWITYDDSIHGVLSSGYAEQKKYGDTRTAIRIGESLQGARRFVGDLREQTAGIWYSQDRTWISASENEDSRCEMGLGSSWPRYRKSVAYVNS